MNTTTTLYVLEDCGHDATKEPTKGVCCGFFHQQTVEFRTVSWCTTHDEPLGGNVGGSPACYEYFIDALLTSSCKFVDKLVQT